jgi:ABC transporter transmembrane region 2
MHCCHWVLSVHLIHPCLFVLNMPSGCSASGLTHVSTPADIPKLSGSLAELVREWVTCSIDAVFYAWQLRSYTRTDKYTAGIVAYVLGAGIATSAFAPSFGSLAKKEQELEGAPATAPQGTIDASNAVKLFCGASPRWYIVSVLRLDIV